MRVSRNSKGIFLYVFISASNHIRYFDLTFFSAVAIAYTLCANRKTLKRKSSVYFSLSLNFSTKYLYSGTCS